MSNELTTDQNIFIEEIIYEMITFYSREADLMYHQGMKDSVWMLKTLVVLA